MKTGIVCEGGGMRGSYTAGVLQAFMDGGFAADVLVGVSAGASNGVSYVSGQAGRGMRTNINYAGDKRYASWQSFVRTGSFFGMDYIFGEIPDNLDPFDFEAFHASRTNFFAGATDIHTGKAVFFGKEDIGPGLVALRASCSLPALSKIVPFKGGEYLDGGVATPIPFEKALEEGCDKLVVVLTQPRGYRKKAQGGRAVYHALYRKYPNLVKAIDMRHLVYNHALQKLRKLEQEGKAIVVAPRQALGVDRFGKDAEKLREAYELGLGDGADALRVIDNG